MNHSKNVATSLTPLSWGTARAYDVASSSYSDYADGRSCGLFDFSGRYAYADRHVWEYLSNKLTKLRRSGATTFRILDAGCGPGTWTRRLIVRATELGFTTIIARGFDLSATQVQLARERSQLLMAQSGLSLDFQVDDISNTFPEDDGSVDLAICLYSVLNHVPITLLPHIVDEFARVVSASGSLITSVRAAGGMPSAIVAPMEDVRRLRLDHRRDWCQVELDDGRRFEFGFHLFSSSELDHYFSRAFEIEYLEGLDFFHHRFSGDSRWNPSHVQLSGPLLQKLEELEETFAADPDYADHANHLLLVGGPRPFNSISGGRPLDWRTGERP